ncbi:MAG TPA: radical SAM protein [Acidobacteriota bacterium]|nr:radical SAM protein [Acidobacteriota bacterium]
MADKGLESKWGQRTEGFERPYVVSWNLTYKCNLACQHCYLDAGPRPKVESENFLDRSELDTRQCFKVVDEVAALAPECVTILTGGEPLLRRDILEIVRYADSKELWVVVGTNGVRVSDNLAKVLKQEGVRGMALSLDALEAERHDRFRMVEGAWQNTVDGARILHRREMPFIVQTTVGGHNAGELESIADFAYQELGAKVWNLYFLVQTGRGQYVSDLEREDYDRILGQLADLQQEYRGRMLVNAKCAPHYVRTLFERDPQSPFLKTFVGGAGGCPAGTQYMGIRPNGDVTPCPYLPVFAGNLRRASLSELWKDSTLFADMRRRKSLGGRCGECEFNGHCGGCRARAYGMTGDYMAEDPLCSFQPGPFTEAVRSLQPRLEYGRRQAFSIDWDAQARQRMKRIPAFVRGMVVKRVEEYCRQQGMQRVTTAALDEIRSRMPANRIFGKG